MLQCQIILQLNVAAVATVTELAQLLQAERASVSRSLRTLSEQGVTVQTDARLELSEAGREEAKLISRSFGNTPKKLRQKADEYERMATLIPREMLIPPSMRSILLPPPPLFDVQQHAAHALKSLNVLSDVKVSLPPPSALINSFQNAITPLIDAQERISGLWKQLLPAIDVSRIAGLITPTQGIIAALISDASAIAQSQQFQNELLASSKVELLASTFLSVSQHYDNLILDYTQENIQQGHKAATQIAQRVVLPTLTTAQYTRSVRAVYDIEVPLSSFEGGTERSENLDLDSLLGKINPRFVEIRQGAWAALKTRNPDYLRHAGTSQRALLEQMLETLVPNDMLPDEVTNKQGANIKPRTKLLGFSESESSYADAMGKAMLEHYRMLNGYTHGNNDDEIKCRLILQTGETFIHFLLVTFFSRQSEENS